MLVCVMTEVLGGGTLFVLAIGARRRPACLERQDQHQDDEEKAPKHRKHCNRYGVCLQSANIREHTLSRAFPTRAAGASHLPPRSDLPPCRQTPPSTGSPVRPMPVRRTRP